MPNRTTIRSNIQSVLVAEGSFGARVYIGRYDPIPEANLPAARVSLRSEEITPLSHIPRRVGREAEYVVEIYAVESSGTEVEAALDTLTQAVEEAIDSDTTLSGACKDIIATRIDYEVSTENNKDFARAEMAFRVYYETVEA